MEKEISPQIKKDRIDYIDILRAIGIIAMVMGHVNFGSVFNNWIHFFHMPMFFIVSGFFYREHSFSSMIKKRIRTLIIPYLFFGILHCLLFFIINRKVDFHAFYLLFWKNTEDRGVPIAGALWFLTAMFITELLFWCIQKLKLSILYSSVLSVIFAIAGMAISTFLPFRIPLAIDAGMVGVGLFQIGKIIKEKWQLILKIKFIYSLLGIVLFSVLGLICPYINMRTGNYGIWPMFWVNSVGMTLSLWFFSRYAYNYFENKKYMYVPLAWLKGIGRDSIVYLCLNQLAILLAGKLTNFIFSFCGINIIIFKKLLILVFAMSLLFVAQIFLTKTKFKGILGR